jgi:hypothetical protein
MRKSARSASFKALPHALEQNASAAVFWVAVANRQVIFSGPWTTLSVLGRNSAIGLFQKFGANVSNVCSGSEPGLWNAKTTD